MATFFYRNDYLNVFIAQATGGPRLCERQYIGEHKRFVCTVMECKYLRKILHKSSPRLFSFFWQAQPTWKAQNAVHSFIIHLGRENGQYMLGSLLVKLNSFRWKERMNGPDTLECLYLASLPCLV